MSFIGGCLFFFRCLYLGWPVKIHFKLAVFLFSCTRVAKLNITKEYYNSKQTALFIKPSSNWAKVFTRLNIPDNTPALMFSLLATEI